MRCRCFSEPRLSDAIVTLAPGMIRGHDDFVHIRGHEVALNPLINGVSFWENTHSVFSAGLSPDVIETANVMTGGFPAEYGNRFGGVIDIVTRSGTTDGEPRRRYGERRRLPDAGAWERNSAAAGGGSAISCSAPCSNQTVFSARPIPKRFMTTREAGMRSPSSRAPVGRLGFGQGRLHGRRNELRDSENRARRRAPATGDRTAGHTAADGHRRLDAAS